MPGYVDSAVSQAKFAREVGNYRTLERDYRARGWLLLEARFPHVLVALAALQLRPPSIVTGVELDYTNYDAEPPSVRLVNPFSGVPYLAKDLPTQLLRNVGQLEQLAMGPAPMALRLHVQPLMVSHGPDEVPFLCISGVREYHNHPGHSGDSWELHRTTGAGQLVRILEVIHKYGVEPIARYQVQPQVIGLEINIQQVPA
ncbi:MAG: putative metal-binding protein [Candidatus Dormibacteria bacterium]